jgi:hypothetical protein
MPEASEWAPEHQCLRHHCLRVNFKYELQQRTNKNHHQNPNFAEGELYREIKQKCFSKCLGNGNLFKV